MKGIAVAGVITVLVCATGWVDNLSAAKSRASAKRTTVRFRIGSCVSTKKDHRLARWTPSVAIASRAVAQTVDADQAAPDPQWIANGFEACAKTARTSIVTVDVSFVGREEGPTFFVEVEAATWSDRRWLRVIATTASSYTVFVFEVINDTLIRYLVTAPYLDPACHMANLPREYWIENGANISDRMRGEWKNLPGPLRSFMCKQTSPGN